MEIKKTDLIKPSAFKPMAVSDGTYHAIVVGYVCTHKHFEAKGKQPEKEYDAVRFALEIMDDENEPQIIQTADMNLSLNEKSSLCKMLLSWTKAKDSSALWDILVKQGICTEESMNLEKFFGKHVGVMIVIKASKNDESKTYPEITNLIPAKAKDTFELVPEKNIWVRKYDDVIEAKALDGFSIKYPDEEEAQASDKKTGEEAVKSEDAQDGYTEAEAGDLPF